SPSRSLAGAYVRPATRANPHGSFPAQDRGLRCSPPSCLVLPLHLDVRKARIAAMVAVGSSFISQWPEFGITSSVTLTAASRITTASVLPNDLSPPTARTGIVSFVDMDAILSRTSCLMERN